MKQIFTTVIFLLLYCTGFSQTWIQKQTFPGANRARNGAFSIPSLGKGYIVGGGGLQSQYLPDCWAYDTLSDSWTQVANYPGNDDDAICFSANGKGYATTGGACCPNYTNAMFEYDPVGDSWATKTPMPGDPRTFCVGFDIDGKFYVGGGVNNLGSGTSNANPYKDFYAYDPGMDSWTRIADCPASGVNAFAIGFAINGKGYVGTGDTVFNNGSSYVATKDFWEYDPVMDHWTRKADFAGGTRAGAVGFATCNYGYLSCGATVGSQSQTVNDFWRYDPVNDNWTQLTSFSGADRVYASVFGFKNTAYICDGFVPSTSARPPELYEFIQTVIPAFTTGGSTTTTICVGQSVSFTDTSNFAPTHWLWNFPGGTPGSSTNKNPVVQYDTAGNYDVTLSAWNGCDSATKIFSLYVTVSSSAPLSVSPASPQICPGDTVTLTASGGTGITWSPSTGLNVTSGNIVIATATAIADSIIYNLSGTNALGCLATGRVTVYSGGGSTPGTIQAVRDTICQGTPGNLTLSGNSSGSIQWQSSTDDINFANVSGDTLAKYKTNPLSQTTWYRAIVGSGVCAGISDTLELFVPPSLIAYFSTKQTGANQLSFNSDSSLGKIRSYHWDFGDNSTSADSNPSHTYAPKDTTYYVCLTLYDGSNCSYTFCRYSEIADGIPTISANGDWIIYPNPFNNELIVRAQQISGHIESVEMYDMLGRLVINKNMDNLITTGANINLQLDVTDLAKGMYYLMIKTVAVDYVQKVVKQ